MLLVEGWQELHEHEQQDSKSMTLDYIHLQQEHRVSASSMPCLQDSMRHAVHTLTSSSEVAAMHVCLCNGADGELLYSSLVLLR